MAVARVLRTSLAPLAEIPVAVARGADGMTSLLRMLDEHSRICVITGAGISTSSGIPDYRSPGRVSYTPLQHGAFVRDERVRQRYWARSLLGYSRVRTRLHAAARAASLAAAATSTTTRDDDFASPNTGHYAIARLQHLGAIHSLITQNVDGLHAVAGSAGVIELHGSIHRVDCMNCGFSEHREATQARMIAHNTAWIQRYVSDAGEGAARPDGDLNLSDEACRAFATPPCPACGKIQLKPGVVFHGGSVPTAVASAASSAIAECDAVVAIGTTLTTFSAYRLVRDAARGGKRVGIVNFGVTRGDEHADVRVSAHTSSVCAAMVAHVEAGHVSAGSTNVAQRAGSEAMGI